MKPELRETVCPTCRSAVHEVRRTDPFGALERILLDPDPPPVVLVFAEDGTGGTIVREEPLARTVHRCAAETAQPKRRRA